MSASEPFARLPPENKQVEQVRKQFPDWERYESFESQEEENELSPTDKVRYDLYWIAKCQSSSTWHHERNENGCMGCINTLDSALDHLKLLDQAAPTRSDDALLKGDEKK